VLDRAGLDYRCEVVGAWKKARVPAVRVSLAWRELAARIGACVDAGRSEGSAVTPTVMADGCCRHQNHNLQAAYLHVLADAVTSVLALVALAVAAWQDAPWLDPLVGFVGAGLVGWWSGACCARPRQCSSTSRGPTR
jgi:hypothetical protein